jgi:hypothetical protein
VREYTPSACRLAEPFRREQGGTELLGYFGDQLKPELFLSFVLSSFLNTHILELARFEYFAALEALYKLGIFVAADDLHARMLTRFIGILRLRERLGGHKSGSVPSPSNGEMDSRGISGILAFPYYLSRASLLNVKKLENIKLGHSRDPARF